MNRRTNRRKGMSLLEVIIALAVFLMSITGLVFLMGIANDNAMEAQMRSQAMSICQSQLSKAACGSVPLSGQSMSPSEDDSDYQVSMDADPGSFNGLFTVTVTVTRKRANGTELECSLTQMILDPSIVGTVFDSAKSLQTPSTDSGTTTAPATSAATPAVAAAAAKPTTMPNTKTNTMPSTKTGGSTSSTPKTGGSTTPSSKTGGSTTPSSKTGGSTTPSSKTGG